MDSCLSDEGETVSNGMHVDPTLHFLIKNDSCVQHSERCVYCVTHTGEVLVEPTEQPSLLAVALPSPMLTEQEHNVL